MSIIHEALKKVEQTQKPSALAKDKEQNNAPKKTKKLLLGIYVIAIIAGLAAGSIIFSLITPKQGTPRSASPQPATKPLTDTPAPGPSGVVTTLPSAIPSQPKKVIKGHYILNGVFSSGSECYALVNNQIIKAGDTVDGATVTDITLEGVTLAVGDETQHLRAR